MICFRSDLSKYRRSGSPLRVWSSSSVGSADAKFEGRRSDAKEFALRHRVLLLRHESGVPLDVALGALPFEVRSVDRSSLWRVDAACELRTCSAEDLIVRKAFAGRPQDWLDLERVLMRQRDRLDATLIFRELEPLADAKEEPEIVTRLRALFSKLGILP